MNEEKKIKSLMKQFKAAHNRAMNKFYDIVDIIDFEGFGEDIPNILTLSDGTIIVSYDDVDIELEDVIPYLNEYNELTKEAWCKIICNINPSEN